MEIANVFINFRPIYILFIVILIITLMITIFLKNHDKIISEFTLAITSIISFAVSAFMTYQIGILSDELGVGGDVVSFVMFIVVVILSFVNVVVYYFKKRIAR
ncbi:hypothetical protein [Paenibacillus lautus]|uniref:hypothetical protein n=1 Tax=Paenibacillus lautus TaxID=1401 RepID=UPI000FD855A0|nr:hypothetical protein [Paenibacillus lautus]